MIKALGKKLGHGHFGEVYEADDSVRGAVAVKVLKRGPKVSAEEWEELQQNLLSEAQRLVKASHQHVVQVHHVEPGAGGELRLVMERCAGSMAASYQEGPMPLKKVRDIATSVTLGLESIHARDMLHRDIKPANILVDYQGRAKLGDFGLVTDKIIYGYASVGDKKYAPHLAKEVWDGFGTSKRTDIWALGMTIYRFIHGEEWYETRAPDFHSIQRGGYAKKLPWLAHVPKAWRSFIRKCLHDDTTSRFQDAGGVLASLAKLEVLPNWCCDYDAARTTWTAVEAGRRIVVEVSPAIGAWTAVSFPLKTGRKRSLGGSKAIRELEQFFQAKCR